MYRVVYENQYFVFIDKLVPVPGIRQGNSGGLSDELLLEYPFLSSIEDFGFTHRLDNETLGLILVAKTKEYYNLIRTLFSNGEIKKQYLARVQGVLTKDNGFIDLKIAHSAKSTKKMMVVKEGFRIFRGKARNAVTEWKVLLRRVDSTDLELSARSGVRHQIRLHMANLGYPICGDRLYGKFSEDYPSLMLISKSIDFICPKTGELVKAVSTLNLDNMFDYIR